MYTEVAGAITLTISGGPEGAAGGITEVSGGSFVGSALAVDELLVDQASMSATAPIHVDSMVAKSVAGKTPCGTIGKR